MEVLSSSRSTILSNYPHLEKKCVYQHAENVSTDFQIFPHKPLFLEVNEKSELELLRIKNTGGNEPEISRVKKMRVENLYCAACPKQGHEIALGLSNGGIKFINYKTSQNTMKFSTDNSRYSVIYLDYNASNEYLSSVLENGVINLYGLKTRTKLETLSFDNNCTLARFHPTKKFQLSVASYKGSVFVYDIESKRKIFQAIESHGAPCKDICMSPNQPDVVLSAGFDCIINVFDTRRKLQQHQIKHSHPLSSIAMSDCGTFCCVGNLKGELISYDLRNVRNCLSSQKVHDNGVKRVSFVPVLNGNNSDEKTATSNSTGFSQTNMELNSDNRKSVYSTSQSNTQSKRDSFCDFIEFHSYKLKTTNSRFSTRRDSFDWELLGHKNPETNCDFRLSTASRLSTDARVSLDAKPRNYVDLDSVEVIKEEDNDQDCNNSEESNSEVFLKENVVNKTETGQRLKYIEEEKEDEPRYSGGNYVTTRKSGETKSVQVSKTQAEYSDKEHALNASNRELEGFLKLPDDKNSTPNNCKRLPGAKTQLPCVGVQEIFAEMQKMRTEMDAKFKQLEFEIRYSAECNKSNLFAQNWNLWKKQMDVTEEIKASVECMLQTDPFVNEFTKLQKENEELKRMVLELRRKSK